MSKSNGSTSASSSGVQAWYTYCPVFCAGNVDSELGWIEEEYKKMGAKLDYLRSKRENDFLPHFTHSMNNLFRQGGCVPAIHAMADVCRTKLLGLTWQHEGGGMVVRVGEGLDKMTDLKGKRIGIDRSQNRSKSDWWHVTQDRGIELMLKLNGMTAEDVKIVEYPYKDDWYSKPEKLEPLKKPSEMWVKPGMRHYMAFHRLERLLENGEVDALYSADGMYQAQERTGKLKLIENLANYPDWTLQVANSPYTLTVDTEFAEKHPDLIVAYMRGIIKVGRWINANKMAAASLLYKTTFHPTVEDTAKAIADIDFVPDLSPMNLKAIEIEKDFMLRRGYIKNDFNVQGWMAPEFAEAALKELGD